MFRLYLAIFIVIDGFKSVCCLEKSLFFKYVIQNFKQQIRQKVNNM